MATQETRRYRHILAASVLGILLSGCAQRESDRAGAVQGPLFLFIVLFPALTVGMKRRGMPSLLVGAVTQVLLYLMYESGVSYKTNIRVDLLVIYPMIVLNVILALILGVVDAAKKK